MRERNKHILRGAVIPVGALILVAAYILINPQEQAKTSNPWTLIETGASYFKYYNNETHQYRLQIFTKPQNIYENGKWIDYKSAKSLKNFWQVRVLKSDNNTPLEVVDYNYTHLVLSVGSNRTGQIPFTMCKEKCSNISITVSSVSSKQTVTIPIVSAIDYKNLTWGINSTVIQITNGNVLQDTNTVGGAEYYKAKTWGDSLVLAVGNVTTGSLYEGVSYVKFDLSPYTSLNGTKFYSAQFGMTLFGHGISTGWFSPAIYHVYNSTIYTIDGVEWLEGSGNTGTAECPTGGNGGNNASGVLTYNSQPTVGQWNTTYESFVNITSSTANGTSFNWTATNMVATELNSGGKNITIKIQGAYLITPPPNFNIYNCTLWNSSEATSGKPYLNITYEQDSIAPNYSLNSTNTTTAGSSVLFSLFWHDYFNTTTEGNLSSYIFSFSNGANWSWSNQTADLESGTQTVRGSQSYYEGFEGSFLPAGWTTGYTGTTTKTPYWFQNNTNVSVGTYSAESGYSLSTEGNINSWINVTQTYLQAGTIVFDWRVSSENNYDWLMFTMDNTTTACTSTTNRISGTATGWATKTFNVPTGTHWFTWCYSKDPNTIGGNDAGWVDNVTFVNMSNPIDANSSYVTYNTINNNSVLNPITNITVTVGISSYNKYDSMNNSNSYPDLWLEIYNGSAWVEIGNMSVTGAGNFSSSTTTGSILTGWQTLANRNIRIKGRFLDLNSSVIYDEINWTGVWVTINSTSEFLNDSSVTFSPTSNESWSNVTKTINSTVGAVIKWCVYAYDSANNLNSTSCSVPFNFTTTQAGGNPDINYTFSTGIHALKWTLILENTDCQAPDNQTGSYGVFNITNNGTLGATDVQFKINQTLTGIKIIAGNSSTCAGSPELTTDYQTLYYGLDQGNSMTIWMWFNVTSPGTQRKFKVNITHT